MTRREEIELSVGDVIQLKLKPHRKRPRWEEFRVTWAGDARWVLRETARKYHSDHYWTLWYQPHDGIWIMYPSLGGDNLTVIDTNTPAESEQ